MSQHTPTPWSIYGPAQGDFAIIQNGRIIAETFRMVALDQLEPAEANARRIVAAVNACEGIGSEALESGLLTTLVGLTAMIAQLIDVEHLDAACEGVVKLSGDQVRELKSLQEQAAAALARAKGGAR